jgi:hypothetical protein
MRTFMLATLMMTFASGVTSGYLVGHSAAPPAAPRTWIDNYIDLHRAKVPGISEQDLADARKIYEEYDERVKALKSEADALLRDQLLAMQRQTEQKIHAIIDRVRAAEPGSK